MRSRPAITKAAPESGVSEQTDQRLPQRTHVPRWDEQPGLLVHDEVAKAAHVTGDDRARMGHGLGANDSEPLTVRRARHDGGPRVPLLELVVREEPERTRDLVAQRPVPDDHERQPVGRGDEVAHSLLRREPARVEDLRRLRLLAHLGRELDAAGNDPDVLGTETPRVVRQGPRRRGHEPRPPEHPHRQCGCAPRKLDVRPMDLDDERPSRRHRHDRSGEPVRVHEIRVRGGPARGPREASEHQRQREREIRLLPEVSGHSRPVRDPVVPEARRRHDPDVDATLADVLHLVGDEEARNVSRPARVRRRQDDDLQDSRRRANTIGVARASRASA